MSHKGFLCDPSSISCGLHDTLLSLDYRRFVEALTLSMLSCSLDTLLNGVIPISCLGQSWTSAGIFAPFRGIKRYKVDSLSKQTCICDPSKQTKLIKETLRLSFAHLNVNTKTLKWSQHVVPLQNSFFSSRGLSVLLGYLSWVRRQNLYFLGDMLLCVCILFTRLRWEQLVDICSFNCISSV